MVKDSKITDEKAIRIAMNYYLRHNCVEGTPWHDRMSKLRDDAAHNHEVVVNSQAELDNDGQVILYTGIYYG